MVAPSTMILLIVLLVNQAGGASFFSSPLFQFGYACPVLKNCDVICPKGYEVTLIGCSICRCRNDRACHNFYCSQGYHCESIMRISWFYLKRAHCERDIPSVKLIPTVSTTPTTTTTTTTTVATTTTTTRRPSPPITRQICEFGRPKGNPACGIKKSCVDSQKQKCVILYRDGNGVCCLKDPPEQAIPRETQVGEMPRCQQIPDVGPCRGMVPRYFYNSTVGYCQKFNYGGCRENENNFADMKSCRVTCENPCNMTPTAGRCRAAIVRYFYNSTSEQCERFTFGGCQGNGNNWKTLVGCRAHCDKSFNSYFMGKNDIDKDAEP